MFFLHMLDKFEVVLYVSVIPVQQLLHLADYRFFSISTHKFEKKCLIADGY